MKHNYQSLEMHIQITHEYTQTNIPSHYEIIENQENVQNNILGRMLVKA